MEKGIVLTFCVLCSKHTVLEIQSEREENKRGPVITVEIQINNQNY